MSNSELNRTIWIVLFVLAVVIVSWLEWTDSSSNTMGWFLATGLLSAVCSIGYSICDALVQQKDPELEGIQSKIKEGGDK